VLWSSSEVTDGQSTTPLFAVSELSTTDSNYVKLVATMMNVVSADETPFLDEGSLSGASVTQTGGVAPTAIGGPTGTQSTIAITTSGPTGTSETSGAALATGFGNNATSAASASASTGLSTGAIAGIAVACGVLGLALIGALIWFMCFRRRRNDHTALGQHTGGYASDGAAAMMADKELPHVSADSPRSTYASDRGQLSHDLPIGGGGGVDTRGPMAAAAVTHEDAPYAPYSDRAPTTSPGATTTTRSQTDLVGAAATGTRSPTPPISTRYAHLIEEGMTEDEIRRLDEEERQLDAAIEAGRSSRAA
jgi:hypothetical protein